MENGIIEGSLLSFGPGGLTGVLGDRGLLHLRVAPATEQQHNTLRPGLFPIACWRANDANFAFDSSFLQPGLAREMAALQALRVRHPGAPLSLFGHADPIGNDEYNKGLSGRRAKAIFALLTRQHAIFEELFSQGDWGDPALRAMLTETEGPPGTTPSDARVKDVRASAAARRTLYAAYMEVLCRDERGAAFVLGANDFLAGGRDPGGKGDFQGCSEFNPVLIFSKSESAAFEADKNKEPRNRENAPNRRVVALLFRPGVRIDPARWPCPRANEGSAGCRKRFWSDHEERRQFREKRRLAEVDRNTFACRFYDRLTMGSPCDAAVAPRVGLIFMKIFDGDGRHLLSGRRYEINPAKGPGQSFRGTIDKDGLLRHEQVLCGDYLLRVDGCDETSPVVVLDPADPEPRVRCLENSRLAIVVRTAGGPTIQGATVEVEGLGTKETDSEGVADFGHVQPGTFRFTAHKDGFVASGKDLVFALTPGSDTSASDSVTAQSKAEGQQNVAGRRALGAAELQAKTGPTELQVIEIKAFLPGTPSAQLPSQKSLPKDTLRASTPNSRKLDDPANPPVVLVMGGGVIEFVAETNPPGQKVTWTIEGNPNKGAVRPALTPDASGTKATLLTDQEGAFSVVATLGKSSVVWNLILVAVIVDVAAAVVTARDTEFVDMRSAPSNSLHTTRPPLGSNQVGVVSGAFFDPRRGKFDGQAWSTEINVELRAAGTDPKLFTPKIRLGYLQNLTFQNVTGHYDKGATAQRPTPQNALLLDAPEVVTNQSPPFPVVEKRKLENGGLSDICPLIFGAGMLARKNFSPDLTKLTLVIGDSPGAGFEARVQQSGGSQQILNRISGFSKYRAAIGSFSLDAVNTVVVHADCEWLVDYNGRVTFSGGRGVWAPAGAHTTHVTPWKLLSAGTHGTGADAARFEIFPPLAIEKSNLPQKTTF